MKYFIANLDGKKIKANKIIMTHNFKWKKEYSVHVKEIDDQHKKLIKIIFKLFTAINKQLTKKVLGKIINNLIEYASYHFDTEEKYFKKFNYINTEEHVQEHKNFSEKMLNLKKEYKNNEIEISFELIDFLEDWLINHLITTDQKYIECFKDNGLK